MRGYFLHVTINDVFKLVSVGSIVKNEHKLLY